MRRAANEDGQVAKSQFIDILADTQVEPAELAVDAGVGDLKILYHNGNVAMPVLLTIQTSTGMHRGVHMSRLVHAASKKQAPTIEGWLKAICAEVNRTQPGARISCVFEMPYADQFIPVVVKTSEKGAIRYQFTAKGMTACPCSKRMIGIGHMQRAEITMVLERRTALDSTAAIEKMEECFSAVPTERMKRVEEAKKILEAQENARFAEDLVRECVKRFPNALYVRSRCFESIHAHDAIATWSKNARSAPL
jgi:GTP cyclohydrolase FolE2